MLLVLRGVLLMFVLGAAFMAAQPSLAEAQGRTDDFLDNLVCRDDPYSRDCICAGVRQFGFFPKAFDQANLFTQMGVERGKDVDGDNYFPILNNSGVWVDDADEDENYSPADPANPTSAELALRTDLQFAADDRYNRRCALSYYRENVRRLWVFLVASGSLIAVFSLIWVGVTYMQYSASGVSLYRAQMILARVLIGLVILACSAIIWEGISAFLFSGFDFWTLDRDVFYEFR